MGQKPDQSLAEKTMNKTTAKLSIHSQLNSNTTQ
jgi:hypothetical protein